MKHIDISKFFDKNTASPSIPLTEIAWEEVVKECYDQELAFIYPVIQVIYADDKSKRAVILQKPDATYTICFETLFPFSDDELKHVSNGRHGFWSPDPGSVGSLFDTKDRAITAVYSVPPFKYNRCIKWADCSFRIDAEKLYWIGRDGMDDPDDVCLHGDVIVKIGSEILAYSATVSAAGLYLLRTLTENHTIHDGQAMLPCCGHSMYANDDFRSVHISGCPNGLDWSVIHEDGRVKLVTESGIEAWLDWAAYRDEVCSFADQIKAFYKAGSPKHIEEDWARNGYVAFWREWLRRREQADA